MHDIINDISEFIYVEDKPQKADAIMVAGGELPELPERAAQLWRAGYAPHIFIGGRFSITSGSFKGPDSKRDIYCKDYATEYDFYKDVLLLNGVDEAAILGEARSTFTKENAVFAKQAADALGLKPNRVLLVCKSFHARRCLMYFQSAFPGTEFLVIPVAGFGITKANWFRTEPGIEYTLGELARCGSQFTIPEISGFIK